MYIYQKTLDAYLGRILREKAYYSNKEVQFLNDQNIKLLTKCEKPPNKLEILGIEGIWGLIKREVYKYVCEAENLDHLRTKDTLLF